ncbi:cyclic nucleotide-gated channel rod photoreceptor subunit alpha-like [Lethenteron reissneri]|uniref:cyclic nucleotide-gated channel rod photoreceptor subunit alpha-like n=1 Tax=Lethenteron reissneri TaxID=7753 RepID=UPI002AB72230|nr:cyclic nucleotide-gated channel rod photoreceptor subunit alpha-like [Lethenteron reissneri]
MCRFTYHLHTVYIHTATMCASEQDGKARVVEPGGGWHSRWQLVACVAVVYNWLAVVCRASFPDIQRQHGALLLPVDFLCDAVYLAHMALASRTGFMERGFLVTDTARIRDRYLRSSRFKLDVLSVLPTDILYLWVGTNRPELRFNRLLRVSCVFDCFDQIETRTKYPKSFRIFKLVVYIFVMVHWNACVYFLLSAHIGFGTDGWVYPNTSTDTLAPTAHQYLHSLFFSSLVLFTVGNMPQAERDAEFAFTVVDLLITVFVFATIVEYISGIVLRDKADVRFIANFCEVRKYVERHGIGRETERRVVAWLEFLHFGKKALGSGEEEEAALRRLPITLRAAIAIDVHMHTLRKVELFRNCEMGLLEELVLKLRPKLYSAGDYVCRKGDVGREMYFVKDGNLAVVADDGVTLHAILAEGSYFGEISLLNISGSRAGNRRTANIRSIGYSDLFCLSKGDLEEVLCEYPAARDIMEEKGRQILAGMALLSDDVAAPPGGGGGGGGCCAIPGAALGDVERSVGALQVQVARLLAEHRSMQRRMNARLCELERIWGEADSHEGSSGID